MGNRDLSLLEIPAPASRNMGQGINEKAPRQQGLQLQI
jgi:hypothetical protein